MIERSAIAAEDRALRALATGLRMTWQNLQPGGALLGSPGDRIVELANHPGLIADTAERALGLVEEILRWLEKALTDASPWLVQVDVLLALGGVAAGVIDGAAGVGAGLADVGADLSGGDPGQVLGQFQEMWPQLGDNYKAIETHAAILPPPEDVAEAIAALAPLLERNPTNGRRSLPSVRAQLSHKPGSPP